MLVALCAPALLAQTPDIDPRTRSPDYDPVSQPELQSPMARLVHTKTSQQMYENRARRLQHHFEREYGMPHIRVGGHYNSPFWYRTATWDLARRAMFLYQNSKQIDPSLYHDALEATPGLRDEVDKLWSKNTPVEATYVDSEFADSPDLMFTDMYVDAVMTAPFNEMNDWVMPWGTLCLAIVVIGVVLFTIITFSGVEIVIPRAIVYVWIGVVVVIGYLALTQ